MKLYTLTLCLCVVFIQHGSAALDPYAVFKGLIQTNIVGLPVLGNKQTWIFDPDVSLRRRREFEEVNGVRGEKLIERLGAGIDGFGEERLKKERLRNMDLVGGLYHTTTGVES